MTVQDVPVSLASFKSHLTALIGKGIKNYRVEDETLEPECDYEYDAQISRDKQETLCVSPDGELLAIGSGSGVVTVLERKTLRETSMFRQHSNSVLSITIDPRSAYAVSISSDKSCFLWAVKNGTAVQKLDATNMDMHLRCACFPRNKQNILFLGETSRKGGARVVLWEKTDPERQTYDYKSNLKATNHALTAMCVSDDGLHVAISSSEGHVSLLMVKTSGLVKVWSTENTWGRSVAPHILPVTCMKMNPNKEYIFTTSADYTVNAWKIQQSASYVRRISLTILILLGVLILGVVWRCDICGFTKNNVHSVKQDRPLQYTVEEAKISSTLDPTPILEYQELSKPCSPCILSSTQTSKEANFTGDNNLESKGREVPAQSTSLEHQHEKDPTFSLALQAAEPTVSEKLEKTYSSSKYKSNKGRKVANVAYNGDQAPSTFVGLGNQESGGEKENDDVIKQAELILETNQALGCSERRSREAAATGSVCDNVERLSVSTNKVQPSASSLSGRKGCSQRQLLRIHRTCRKQKASPGSNIEGDTLKIASRRGIQRPNAIDRSDGGAQDNSITYNSGLGQVRTVDKDKSKPACCLKRPFLNNLSSNGLKISTPDGLRRSIRLSRAPAKHQLGQKRTHDEREKTKQRASSGSDPITREKKVNGTPFGLEFSQVERGVRLFERLAPYDKSPMLHHSRSGAKIVARRPSALQTIARKTSRRGNVNHPVGTICLPEKNLVLSDIMRICRPF